MNGASSTVMWCVKSWTVGRFLKSKRMPSSERERTRSGWMTCSAPEARRPSSSARTDRLRRITVVTPKMLVLSAQVWHVHCFTYYPYVWDNTLNQCDSCVASAPLSLYPGREMWNCQEILGNTVSEKSSWPSVYLCNGSHYYIFSTEVWTWWSVEITYWQRQCCCKRSTWPSAANVKCKGNEVISDAPNLPHLDSKQSGQQ